MVSRLGQQNVIIQMFFRVLYDVDHHLQCLQRIFSRSRLAGEHHRVGTVIDRIGNVRHLRTGGAWIADHGIQHLGRRDHGLEVIFALLNEHLLQIGKLFRGNLHP